MEGPNRLLRAELAKFLPSQRAIRAFEQLFDIVPSQIVQNTASAEEASINAANADSRAQQAVDAISRLADALELLALAPPEATVTQTVDIAPPVVQFGGSDNLSPPVVPFIEQSDLLPPIAEIKRKRYGVFQSSVTQTAAYIDTAYPVTYDITDLSFGVAVGTPTSRVYLDTDGIYNFQFSAQINKTSGGTGSFYIWPRVNGVDIPASASQIRLQGSAGETVAAWNFVLQMNSGDYFELIWSTDDIHCQILASAASAPVPAIPSVILTVTDNIS